MKRSIRFATLLFVLPLVALVLAAGSVAQAGFIGDTDGNTVTATAKSAYPGCGAENMVNGSAMSDAPVLKTSLNINTTWGGELAYAREQRLRIQQRVGFVHL